MIFAALLSQKYDADKTVDEKVFIIPSHLHLNGVHIADFETTVSRDTTKQNKTEVWASALTYMFSENPDEVQIDNTLDKFMNRCFNIDKEFTDSIDTEKIKDKELKEKLDKIMIADIFFHNVRFDGSFIISWLLKNNFKDEFTNEY